MPFSTDPEHIAISKSKGIKIDWKDAHHSEYGLVYLRDKCPCATCNEEREQKRGFAAAGAASAAALRHYAAAGG